VFENSGPGIEVRWGRDFPHPFRPALGPSQSLVRSVPVHFAGGKTAVAWFWPATPILRIELYLISFWEFVAYSRVQFTFSSWKATRDRQEFAALFPWNFIFLTSHMYSFSACSLCCSTPFFHQPTRLLGATK